MVHETELMYSYVGSVLCVMPDLRYCHIGYMNRVFTDQVLVGE